MADKRARSSARRKTASQWKKPLPLSEGHLKNVFQNTSDLGRLCSWLNIPDDKRTAAGAVEYYRRSTQPRKGRKMVFWLDHIGDTALADSVMECAEPPADPSLHPHNVIPVFQALTGDWQEIGNTFIVPPARARLFRERFSVPDQCTEAGRYYALYHPDPSWKTLSVYLYSTGETEALQIARPHIQTVTDPSLTPDNILKATRDIPLWRSMDSYYCLGMPDSLHDEIARKFDGEQAKRKLFSAWLGGHPCPTWDHVEGLLRWLESEGAAEEVKETYLKMTPEKVRLILDASLQDGSLLSSYLKILAAGVPRSGKTLSKKHVFGMEYDANCSSSTGACEGPIYGIRTFSWELIDASLRELKRLSHEGINEILAHKLRHGYLRGNVAQVAEDILKASSESWTASATSEGVAESGVLTPSSDSAATNAVVTAFTKPELRLAREEELFKLQVILFLDSGGQPQFHEFLAALSHNVSLVLLFLKLNERLDAPCHNAFTDEKGEWFEEQCPSLLTNEQMLVQFVHTMMCKPLAHNQSGRTRFMVIGTHRDLLQDCDETLAQKNERLASLFLPALEEVLIMNGNDIIFAVNAKNPNKKDEECYALIRQKVADLRVALEVETPMSSLMFLNDLIRYGEEQRKRVVSMEECQAIAGRLKMDRQSLEASLVHFNNLSMFLYQPSVLPDRVFIDPQMPLDGVNRIVSHSYQIGCGAIKGLPPTESRLWKEGVVTSEMLKGEEFSSCFVSGLFEAKDAIKFFRSLYIAAPLNESEFIMPAMLQAVSRHDVKQYLPVPSEHVAPLFLHFHKSRIANGVFCSTHTCMRSEYGWTTCYVKKRGQKVPACLFRNAVKLQHPTKSIKLTLVHAQKHFEVHLDAPPAELPSECPRIRAMLLDAVDRTAATFRFKNSRASVAFQCPCSPDDVHTAIPNEAHSHLKCTDTGDISRGGLTAAQRVWLGPCTPEALQPSSGSVQNTVTGGDTALHRGKHPAASPLSDVRPAKRPARNCVQQPSHLPTSTHLTPQVSSGSGQSTETGEGDTAQHGASASPSSPPTTQPSPPSRMDERPSLPELLSFPTITGDTINVMSRVGTKYDQLGYILLNDEDGSTVDQIIDYHHHNPERIASEILKRWIRGKGKQPVTWKTLTDTLRAVGLTELATCIETSLTSPHTTQQS